MLFAEYRFTPSETDNTVFKQSSDIILDSYFKIPYNLIKNYGLHSGDKMIRYLSTLFESKGFDKDITFLELYEQTNKVLVITGTSISERETFFFNYKTFPDMKVLDAIGISTSIPIYFTSKKLIIDDVPHRFVDGGVLNNFPLYYFDMCTEDFYPKTFKEAFISHGLCEQDCDNDTIGIMLVDEKFNRNVYDYYTGYNPISSLLEFVCNLGETIMTKIEEANFSNPVTGTTNNYFARTITIPIPSSVSAINFNLGETIRNQLIESGIKSADTFFEDWDSIH